jgi:hypothetical protein
MRFLQLLMKHVKLIAICTLALYLQLVYIEIYYQFLNSIGLKLSIYVSIVLLLDLGRFFSFLILYTVGRTSWTGDQPVARPLPTHRTTQTQNKRTETSMPWMGFEPTIPAFERAKTVHAWDRVAGHCDRQGLKLVTDILWVLYTMPFSCVVCVY